MPDFILKRTTFTDKSTIGELYHYDQNSSEGDFVCYILEDEARAHGVKIKDKTAIPVGDYKISLTYSNRFKRTLPLIYNLDDLSVSDGVHKWEGIRCHPGNTDASTSGCLLPGTTAGKDIVYESRSAFDNKLYPLIVKSMEGKDYLTLGIITSQTNA